MGDEEEVVRVDRATLLKRMQETAKGLEKIQNQTRATTLRRRKVQEKQERLWEKVFTTGVGIEQGEPYYLNSKTGETQWDRPDEYISDTEIEENELNEMLDFDRNKPLADVLEKIGVGDEFSLDQQKMFGRLDGDEEDINAVWDRCEHRMKQLLLCFQHVGTADQWKQKLIFMDFQLPKAIYSYWQAGSEAEKKNVFYWAMKVEPMPDIVRSTVAKFMVITTDMAADDAQKGRYYSKLVDGQWGVSYAMFLRQCETGLNEEMEKKDSSEIDEKPEVGHWLRLLYGVLTYGPPLPDHCRPAGDMIKVLVRIMKEFEEDLFLSAAKVFFAFAGHYPLLYTGGDIKTVQDEPPSDILQFLVENPGSNHLIEAYLYLLNSQHTPYDDMGLLQQLLHFGKLVLQTKSSSNLLLVNDVKVLIDIILLEVQDLPKSDTFRVDYLLMIYMIMKNTSWQYDGHFRRPEIITGIDEVLKSADKGMHPDSCKTATEILLNCARELF